MDSSLPSSAGASRTSDARTRQRQLARDYKDNPPPCGVYAIRCAAAGIVVVQGALNVQGAIHRNRFELRIGSHPDRRLQQAWKAHGEAAFGFEVLDVVKRREDAPHADLRPQLAELVALWQSEIAA